MAYSAKTERLISIKKLSGKAQTSNDKGLINEGLPSGVTISYETVYGEPVPITADQGTDALYKILTASGISGNGQVEYLRFQSEFIAGTVDSGGGRQGFQLKLPADYEANSKNPLAGTYPFKNNQVVNITSGALQLVPPSFAIGYEARPFFGGNTTKDSGDRIFLTDVRDWYIDYFNGVFFQQDPPGSGDHNDNPDFVQGYLYIGKYLSASLAEAGSVDGAAGANTEIQFNDNGAFGASPDFTFNSTDGEVKLHAADPTFTFRRKNNNLQNSDINFQGQGGVVGARLRFSGSASNDLVFSTFTSSTLKERLRIRSNTVDVAIEATGSLKVTQGISGSLTQLTDGSSYLISGNSISITSQSNGSVLISAPNFVFNELMTGVANGINTKFTLSKTPTANKNVSVFVNGQLQTPATDITGAPFQDYSVTGSVVFFTTASMPPEGSIMMANYTTNDTIT
jgi:hypothetical protein